MPSAKTRRRTKSDQPKVSRQFKPDDMTIEEWQTLLRKQFALTLKLKVRNLGHRPAFSDFLVSNAASGSSYRVTVRGLEAGTNSCTCPDYSTNTLGTCKHLEFVLAKLGNSRSAKLELKQGYQPEAGEVYLQYGSQRVVRFVPPIDISPAYRKLVKQFFDDQGHLLPSALAKFDDFLTAATKHDPDLKVGADVPGYLAEVRDIEVRASRVAEAFPEGIRSTAFKDLLNITLYDYQREGVLFAARAGRCLIGDEMGLGKTAQAIGAAEVMARVLGVERVLIVCPTSLKYQWASEISRFTKRTAQVIEGGLVARKQAFADTTHFFKITNYDTVYRDAGAIADWAPDLVILDEAQRIKNWATRVARSVKAIQSPYAVVLTGTPLENRLEELISIVQFVDPHRLGPTFRLLHTHQVLNEDGRVIGYRDLDKIGQTLAPVLLRRQKDQVLSQLPEKIESTIFVPMTALQRDLHEEGKEEVARLVQKWKRYRFLTEADKQRLMMALQRMRMACDSSYLLDPSTDQGLKVGEIMTVLGEYLERPGTKVVLFTQWLRMQELLVKAADEHGWGSVCFNGSVPGRERGKLVAKFRDDAECRLFLSTDAGGVGLNLQFASAVVNVDLPWNPAVLNQRIGRVHRMGQKEPVRVFNFVAKGTIEEGMLGVLKFKSSLFAGVLDGGDSHVELGGSKLTKFIEAVEASTANIPTPPVEEQEETEEATREFEEKPSEPTPETPPVPADPWATLLQAGAAVLQRLTANAGGGSTSPRNYVQKDAATGETYLKLPVPSESAVADVVSALGRLLEGLKK
jgi:superfamily II DNA or RNA helicase